MRVIQLVIKFATNAPAIFPRFPALVADERVAWCWLAASGAHGVRKNATSSLPREITMAVRNYLVLTQEYTNERGSLTLTNPWINLGERLAPVEATSDSLFQSSTHTRRCAAPWVI